MNICGQRKSYSQARSTFGCRLPVGKNWVLGKLDGETKQKAYEKQ